MKTNYLLLFLMLSFLFSCEGERIDHSIINRSIKVNARIDGVKTRATNDTWDQGDAIGIYMLTAGETLSAESVLEKNAKYVTDGSGAFNPATVANDVKFPIDGSNADFVAYYPQGSINAAFEYSINVTDQSNQAAIDLMYSDNVKGLNRESAFVDLSFSHQLSKIIVNIQPIVGSTLSDVKVTIKGAYTRGFFSLTNKSQRVTNTSKANMEMKMSSDGRTAEAIVIPSESLSGITLEITDGLKGYTYDLSTSTNITMFEPGYKYTYTVTLDDREALSAIATINNWTDGPSEEVTIKKGFDVYTPIGSGTQENPYTIVDARNLSPLSGVWVQGYVVGYYATSNFSSFIKSPTKPTSEFTAFAIAIDPEETVGSNTFPIQLPTSIRTGVYDGYEDNFKKEIKIRGNIGSYYGTIGIPSTSTYEFISSTP